MALDPTEDDESKARPLAIGDAVEVRDKFERSWVRGFKVSKVNLENYLVWVTRNSDGLSMPEPFKIEDVHKEKKKNMWWF